jgi:RimJ/RimL family protein N-acetyltransferase
MGRVAALRGLYREQGMSGIATRLLSAVGERTEFVVLQRDLTVPVDPARCAVAFEMRRIDDATLESFGGMPAPFPRHLQYRRRYGQRQCYGASVDGRIVGLMWPVFQADNRLTVSRWRDLWADEARLSSIWIDPALRGTGLMAACLERFALHVARHGFRYLYAFTWEGNEASKRLHLRRGFRLVGRAWRVSFAWQREGGGFYRRQPIPRAPLPARHPGGDLALPPVITG